MKWLKQKYTQIPRPVRTAIQLGLIPLLVLILFIVTQMPVFSGTLALRLAEKANLVGPGRILGIVEHEDYPSISVILAEDDTGYIFCRYYTDSPFERPQLSYREKQGDLTLLACPFYRVHPEQNRLPVLLFCNDPKAEHAEVDLSITFLNGDAEVTCGYSLNAARTADDYFLFQIDIAPGQWTDAENEALDTFARVSQTNVGTTYSRDSYDIYAEVRLFSDGKLCRTEELTVDSVADDAYERFGTQ